MRVTEHAASAQRVATEAEAFRALMSQRRSVRRFTEQSIPPEVLRSCIMTAATAPSGANGQPWFFAVVTDPTIKAAIRQAAEVEERKFYEERASEEFLSDLAPLETNWSKPHLEEAAALIVIFYRAFERKDGKRKRTYYPKESVGIATGFLITALHRLGIATLTHTPNPMSFLNQVLERPSNERPFLILATGYPSPDFVPPDITRKDWDDVAKIYGPG